ncbi:MAG: ribokinase [Rhodospirillales bacterium]|nr:ribokinase [Rhodospirillales bacterium]
MIVVFGSVNLDLIFPLPFLPEPGQTVLGAELRIEPGGKGANQAVAAARDGARVALAGAVGADPFAALAQEGLRSANVDLSRVASVAAATGTAAIAVDPEGRNQIAVAAGANRLARAAQIEDALLGPATTLLLQMECDPAETAVLARRARARGARIILSLAPPGPLDPDVLAALDFLLVNEDEARWLTKRLDVAADTASLAARLGIGVVRTLGAAGVEAACGGRSIRLPAHAVTVIDTTAAGDCLAGVLAAALDRGASLRDALARAVVAAGLCCTRAGSQRSLPNAAETEAALRPVR